MKILLKTYLRKLRLKKFQPNYKYLLYKNKDIWKHALSGDKKKKILVATSIGSHLGGTQLESLLAIALTLRNANVEFLLCDKILPACLDCMINRTISEKDLAENNISKLLCDNCFKYAFKAYNSTNLKIRLYSQYINNKDIIQVDDIVKNTPLSEIRDYKFNDISIGEHALAGALRFYARGDIDKTKYSEHILRQYFKSALITSIITQNLIDKEKYDSALFHHGIYVPQGIIGEVCRKNNVNVINWNPAYRKKSFIFSHNDTYHHTLMNEPVSNWENINWNENIQNKIENYLKSRWDGKKDWIKFNSNPEMNINKISDETRINFSKPCIGLLTNVIWDAQLHYPTNIFPNMIEWILKTVEYFGKRNDVQLIIRIHPAEITGNIPSRQPCINEIKKAFPVLPENIFIIPPESKISTYHVMEKCDSAIIYGTKTGVELTCMGIPVIVAGEAWIKNKGITIDPKSLAEYFKTLDSLPLKTKMKNDQINRAFKYAYHFFFNRMIPLDHINYGIKHVPFLVNINNLSDLYPGKSKGIDLICNGVLNKTEFLNFQEKGK